MPICQPLPPPHPSGCFLQHLAHEPIRLHPPLCIPHRPSAVATQWLLQWLLRQSLAAGYTGAAAAVAALSRGQTRGDGSRLGKLGLAALLSCHAFASYKLAKGPPVDVDYLSALLDATTAAADLPPAPLAGAALAAAEVPYYALFSLASVAPLAVLLGRGVVGGTYAREGSQPYGAVLVLGLWYFGLMGAVTVVTESDPAILVGLGCDWLGGASG